MNEKDQKIFELVSELRSMGCAVAFFTPRQLEHVDPIWIESAMLDRGMQYLEDEIGIDYDPVWPFDINVDAEENDQ